MSFLNRLLFAFFVLVFPKKMLRDAILKAAEKIKEQK